MLLILGIGIFTAGFVLPEKKEKLRQEEKRLGEEQIRELVEQQMKEVKAKVSDVVDETVTYAVEKTERSMERLTNEKIMAVSEYSDTVLEEIHKNHEEVVFLYDMLNDKHQNLKDTALLVEKQAKEARESAETVLQQVKDVEENGQQAEREEEKGEEEKPDMLSFVPLKPKEIKGAAINDNKEEKEKQPARGEKTRKRAVKKQTGTAPADSKPGDRPQVNLSFASAGEDGRNNNEKILTLHKEGKSNMAIAKELGLGIGEVKLVIDLFKGV